ncbi:meiosis-specific protein ASY3 [Impatiens glandulifera]|uniref:meiosis-specific protein ASY3 n=1 Tax=Impatiens glandulifera TaxID=253017 RepID=UPI001FB148C4|nr:meiosis-specific protein ASY3 [Impatiens glandulifera]
MEFGSQRRDGEVSHCRSLGSNCHPSSQSRKISIGIMGDSSKTKPRTTTENDGITAVGQQINNSQNNLMRNGRLNGVKAQCENNKNPSALEQTSSPWVSTRLFQQEVHTSTALHAKENTHIHAASGGSYSRSSAAKEERVTVTQTAKVNQKGYTVAQRETVERSFANVHEVHTPVKEMIEDKMSTPVTRSTEGLRMKLMEILGATSSPVKPVSEFRPSDMKECNLKDNKSQPVMQPIQDSDTIEKDSEDPDYTAKRPVTRPLLRKGASKKVPESKTGTGSYFTRKRKNQENNASPFVDGLSRQQDGTSMGGSKSLGRMGKKSLKLEPNKSLLNAQCETRQTANGSKLKTPAEKISSYGNKIFTSHNLPSEKKDNVGEPDTRHRDDASLESPLRNKRDQTLFNAQCKATKTRKTANESKLKAPAEKISFHGNKTVTSHNLPSEKKGNVGEPDTRHWDDASLESPLRNKRDQTLFNAQCKATKTRKTANESKLKAPAEKISFNGNKTVTSHNLPSEKKGNFREPDTRHRDEASLESPLRNKSDQTCDISCPNVDEPDTRHRDDASPQSPLRTKRDQTNDISYLARESTQQEEFFDPSLKNIVEPSPVFHIPTNGTRPSFADSPLGSPEKDTHGNADHTGNAEQFDSGKFHGFISFLSPAQYHCKKHVEAEAEAELSDDGEEHEDYHFTPWNFTTEDKDATKLPEQCSEETHSDNSPEVSANEDEETEHESPEIANAKEARFTLHPNKKFRSQEGSEVNELSPLADSVKGTEQSNKFEEDSDQNNEDELETVVTILSLALERIEKKIKAATAKKSADIISSAAQEIHVQLQTTDSHIQKDMGKLINLAKLKRKSGEARLEEKQERVRVIYEKFKDDVNQHLQECKSIVSELGSQEAELKQTMEKQNAIHRKLIRQAEEAVESQLKNADRRVTAVNKLAREKTLHLRNAIAAFLEEDDMN